VPSGSDHDIRHRANRRIYSALGAIIVVSAITTFVTLMALSQLTAIRRSANSLNTNRMDVENLLLDLRTAESRQRGYLLTGDETARSRLHASVQAARADIDACTKSAAGTPYAGDIKALRPLVDERLQSLSDGTSIDRGDDGAVSANVFAGRDIMDKLVARSTDLSRRQAASIERDRQRIQGLADLARNISLLTLLLTPILAVTVYYVYIKSVASSRQLDRAKDEFVALASHQLRTPTAGLKAVLSLLAAGDYGPLNERQAYLVQKAVESNNREIAIIDELLNVAQADAGRLTLRPTEFDLSGLVGHVVAEQKPAIDSKGLRVEVIQPEEPVMVSADQEKLSMAIANLVDNARKYTPADGEIKVKVTNGGQRAAVEVADSGIGIEPGEAAHLFDRYQRGSNAKMAGSTGTGLGLYLARRIAELHDGTIRVASRQGEGSRFTIEVPRHVRP
jgi:signal transduction histidine kinase